MEDGKFRFLDNTEKLKLIWENGSHGANEYNYDLPLGAEDEQAIRLEVTVTDADPEYIITAGNGEGQAYSWYIDWGDGTPIEACTGYSYISETSQYYGTAPRHTYSGAGTYPVTITPAATLNKWAIAYAQRAQDMDYSASSNTAKVTKFDTLLTPEMVRTATEIANDSAGAYYQFTHLCAWHKSLKSMGNTRFSRGWGSLTKAPAYFGSAMFHACSSLEAMSPSFTLPQSFVSATGAWTLNNVFHSCSHPNFTMNEIFNLPQKLVGASGTGLFQAMFNSCTGKAFSMNDVFTFPPGITTVGERFANEMFYNINNNRFTMNPVFNLPQDIHAVASITTLSNIFYNCMRSDAFKVNGVFTFPKLTQAQIDSGTVFTSMFREGASTYNSSPQTRTAESIINGNPAPAIGNLAFQYAKGFPDYAGLPDNWK
jgi:hypothetical protein